MSNTYFIQINNNKIDRNREFIINRLRRLGVYKNKVLPSRLDEN